jgi:hypothetical protein
MAIARTRKIARHVLETYYDSASDDAAVLQLWAYCGALSYRAGETLTLHVSTTAQHFDLEIGRDGLTYEPLHRVDGLQGRHHAAAPDCSIAGCGWPVSWRFDIPADWRPGGYLVTLTARRGDEAVEYHHIVLIGAARDAPAAPMILVCATPTWVAYNDWGGSNAYDGIAGPDGNRFSPVLSTQRPWSRGFARLPEGAPRTLPDRPLPPGTPARYPHMEWAWANGYSKKYASAGWATYERHFARWAERQGLAFDIAALHELHANPERLTGHRCAVFVGHDEYWSAPMRDAVDAFVDGGGRAARFAGNFLWQIRMADEGRTQVCYKYVAAEEDPVMGTDRERLVTNAWEVPAIGRPGASTFGVNATRGIYAGLGHCAGRGSGGFTIYRSDHWAFEGAYLGYGDLLGSQARIFGYEVDGLDHIVRDGLPYPTGGDGAPDGLTVLAMGLATNWEEDFGLWGEERFIADYDARFLARSLYGRLDEATLDRVKRGNGMIVHFARGKGEVFTAATCEWVNGLRLADMQVEKVTRNVLERFCRA